MRTFFLLFLVLVAISSQGQASREQPVSRPQAIKATETRLTGTYSSSIITQQADVWQKQTSESPGSATSWFNYYLWTERNKEIESAKKGSILAGIVSDARKNIRQTSEYSMLLYLQSGKKDSAALFKAVELADDKSWIYPYVIQYGIMRQNQSIINTYAKQLETISPLVSALYTYHYNVLMSADSNATIYGRGLFDIVPMAILQHVHNVRKDLRLKYYTANVKKETNSYLCLSLGEEVISKYPQAGYTGLLVKMTDAGIDELKKHIEKDMDLRFLSIQGSYWQNDEAQLFKNYLPSFILLYRHYRDNKNPDAERLLSHIQKIAGRVYENTKVKQLLEK